MPTSTRDRPTCATEKIFLFSKRPHYFYDIDACRVPSAATTIDRDRYSRITSGKDGEYAVAHDHETTSDPGGRNQWNYWEIAEESIEIPPSIAWKIGPEPFKGAHFAVFPTEIPRRAILLGTSEKGCCPVCGAPWVRTTERVPMQVRSGPKAGSYGSRTTDGLSGTMVAPPQTVTVGWQPSCSCDAGDPIPCAVFDPFNGSGTVPLVAEGLGRRGIGADLSRDYLAMAAQRISRPHSSIRASTANVAGDELLPLFKDQHA
jgi:hypothetical protein